MTQDPSLTAVMAEVDEVKGIMVKNIDKALSRGERLDNIMDQAEELQSEVRRLCAGQQQGSWPTAAGVLLPLCCPAHLLPSPLDADVGFPASPPPTHTASPHVGLSIPLLGQKAEKENVVAKDVWLLLLLWLLRLPALQVKG
jgi:hypothetical protein